MIYAFISFTAAQQKVTTNSSQQIVKQYLKCLETSIATKISGDLNTYYFYQGQIVREMCIQKMNTHMYTAESFLYTMLNYCQEYTLKITKNGKICA